MLLDSTVDLKPINDPGVNDPLPGTTKSFAAEDEFIGRLRPLNHTRNVLVLLHPDVDKKVEEVVKETLTGKLRLNLSGKIDRFIIRRSTTRLPASETGPMAPPEGKILGMSPSTLLLTFLLLIAAGVGIYYLTQRPGFRFRRLFNRKKNNQSAHRIASVTTGS